MTKQLPKFIRKILRAEIEGEENGLWAIYKGHIYTIDSRNYAHDFSHVEWFNQLGLPSAGVGYDSILRGTYVKELEGSTIWWHNNGPRSERQVNVYIPQLISYLKMNPATTEIEEIPNLNFFQRMGSIKHNPDEIVIEPNDFYPQGLSKQQIYDYYKKVEKDLLNQFGNNDIFIVIKTDGTIYKRKEDGNIKITTPEEFEKFNTGRTVEFHVTLGETASYYFIDLDPQEKYDFEKVKKVVKDIQKLMTEIPDVSKVEVRFSGSRGFHIYGYVKGQINVSEGRELMKQKLQEYIDQTGQRDLSIGLTRDPNTMRLDTSTFHPTGSLRAKYSLHKDTGLACIPVFNIDTFDKSMAKIDRIKISKFTGGRFVINEHHAHRAGLHYDLRLEWPKGSLEEYKEKRTKGTPEPIEDGKTVLRSWSIRKGIPEDSERHLAVPTEDHPIAYLNFEGKIPEGAYGAGTMKIYDSGTYNLIAESPDKLIINFNGNTVKGRYNLVRTDHNWLITKAKETKANLSLKTAMTKDDATEIIVNYIFSLEGDRRQRVEDALSLYLSGGDPNWSWWSDHQLENDELFSGIPLDALKLQKFYGWIRQGGITFEDIQKMLGPTFQKTSSLNWKSLVFDTSKEEVMQAIKNKKWQEFRESLKGTSTSEKFNQLKKWLRDHNNSSVAKAQVSNYVGALARGGLISPYRKASLSLKAGATNVPYESTEEFWDAIDTNKVDPKQIEDIYKFEYKLSQTQDEKYKKYYEHELTNLLNTVLPRFTETFRLWAYIIGTIWPTHGVTISAEQEVLPFIQAIQSKLQNNQSLSLNQKIVLFHEALNTMHAHGTMADYLFYPPDLSRGEEEYESESSQFLNELSEGVYIPRWQAELRKESKSLSLKTYAKFDKATVQTSDLPDEVKNLIKEIQKTIPKEDLYDKNDEDGWIENGLQKLMHVTILYGIKDKDFDTIKEVYRKDDEIEITTDRIDYFEADDHVCAVVRCKSDDLRELHSKLKKTLNVKEDYPTYKPHIAIAYLKPGKKVDESKFKEITWTAKSIEVSMSDGKMKKIKAGYLEDRRRQRITQIISLIPHGYDPEKLKIELLKLEDIPGGQLTLDEVNYVVSQMQKQATIAVPIREQLDYPHSWNKKHEETPEEKKKKEFKYKKANMQKVSGFYITPWGRKEYERVKNILHSPVIPGKKTGTFDENLWALLNIVKDNPGKNLDEIKKMDQATLGETETSEMENTVTQALEKGFVTDNDPDHIPPEVAQWLFSDLIEQPGEPKLPEGEALGGSIKEVPGLEGGIPGIAKNLSLKKKADIGLIGGPSNTDSVEDAQWGDHEVHTDLRLRRKNPPRHDLNDSQIENPELAHHPGTEKAHNLSLKKFAKFVTRQELRAYVEQQAREVGVANNARFEGMQENPKGAPYYTFTDNITGSTILVASLDEVPAHLEQIRKSFRDYATESGGINKQGYEGQPKIPYQNYGHESIVEREEPEPRIPLGPAKAPEMGAGDDVPWGGDKNKMIKKRKPTREDIIPDFNEAQGYGGGETMSTYKRLIRLAHKVMDWRKIIQDEHKES